MRIFLMKKTAKEIISNKSQHVSSRNTIFVVGVQRVRVHRVTNFEKFASNILLLLFFHRKGISQNVIRVIIVRVIIVCSSDKMAPIYFLRLSKVWSMLHHGSVGRV